MSRCLKDKTLLLLYEDEGWSAHRTHLAECEACATRYQQLRSDIEEISRVFRVQPPPKAVTQHSRLFTIQWLPTTAALIMGLLLVLVGARLWRLSTQPELPGTSSGESWSVLDELPANPFLLNEALAVELTTEGGVSYDIAATVLESERPCEWYDLPLPGRTESVIEGLDLSEGSRPALCIEVNPRQ